MCLPHDLAWFYDFPTLILGMYLGTALESICVTLGHAEEKASISLMLPSKVSQKAGHWMQLASYHFRKQPFEQVTSFADC